MKHFLMLLAVALIGLMAFTKNTTILTGKVVDDSGEALIGAIVKVLKDTSFVRGTITDYNGEYRLSLDPGTYDVEVSYTGYQTSKTTGVLVQANTLNSLNISLTSGDILEEVIVTAYKIPLIEQDKTQGGQTLTADQIKCLPTRSVNAVVAKTDGTTSKDMGKSKAKRRPASPTPSGESSEMKIRGARSTATDYYIDGIRVSGEAPPVPPAEMEMLSFESTPADDFKDKEYEPLPGVPGQPTPRAGLLTAGEWNDLHNWEKHWSDMLADGEIDVYQQQYKFFPKNRYSLLLQNHTGLPISDATVQLVDPLGNIIWEARTDNTGNAELWSNLFENGKPAPTDLKYRVEVDGEKMDLGVAVPFAEGSKAIRIKRECKHSQAVDIVWTVDATGSMGDELEYLKTELLDVIGRVKSNNPDLSVRMGSVFYRDQGDDYIVKSSPLNHDIAKTVDYIRKQSANGGGDYPEAVHSALEEAIFRQSWSKEAVARICFLVLDASPHQNPEVLESLQKSIREAAKKGIRIVPVSASGIQKDTEFLMKFFGLATNGSYVFLTDHSGIGGKHIEPTTDEYKVELLNDLLVRIITEYTSVPTCEGKSIIRFADTQQQDPNAIQEPIMYYPNPSSTQFSVDLPFEADKLTLYDAEGKAVRNFAQLGAGTHQVAVNDLPPGFYTLRIWKGNQVQSGKVLVVRS